MMDSRNVVISGVVAGTLIGLAAGILCAPKSGSVMRRFIRSKARNI